MSSGRPIVATDLPTHTQVLDASTAVLVRPTADGLADGIEAILSDPAWASALGEAARERVERDYSFERFRERLAEVYAFIASRRGRRS
jgi:glycosyltransferase involved in cell wall biosynthesis